MSADAELSSILNRRQQINEALDNGQAVKPTFKVVNIYTEFHEFSRKEIKDYQATFSKGHLCANVWYTVSHLRQHGSHRGCWA
uniref:Uncharacterized protein n=1 Tax=Anopheles minimus TaxID=112268 RepID=A0A182VV10_9DIPT